MATRAGRTFLNGDPSPAQLRAALFANMRWWHIRTARAAGGEVRRRNGVLWTYTARHDADLAITLSPRSPTMPGSQIDDVVAYYRQRPVEHGALCWVVDPPPTPVLGSRLAARGFRLGFRPHWMGLDLRRLADGLPPPGVGIEVLDQAGPEVADLPYYSLANADLLRRAGRVSPRRIWHVGAWLDGHLVGHSVLNLTGGQQGVAGIFSVGVVPTARRRGIGAAVTAAACRVARDLGCGYAVLNATPAGEPVYRRIGFTSLGEGQTWWLPAETLTAPPPAPEQVALAEAIGCGDIGALERLAPLWPPERLEVPLPNGMLPLQLAVQSRQERAAAWLVAHGATLDVLSAWDLGWQERAADLLARSPELASRRSGEGHMTPLHEAVLRNDLVLARLLLGAHADLRIEDSTYHSTPLGWAKYLERSEMAALIEQHEGKGTGGG